MVDINVLIAKWMRSLNIVGLPPRGTTGSIYTVALPSDIVISDGPAVVIAGRGGNNNPEISGIVQPRVQISVYDDVGKYIRVRQAYSAIYDAIDGKGNITINGVGTIMSCYEVTSPQDLTDPDTDWPTVVSFYELFARS